MSNKEWKEKWKRNDIAFHQQGVNPLLQNYLPSLALSADDCLLVPLCGKSVDMDWLAKSGFHVIGIELSNIAIQAYFDALQVKPERQPHGRFIRWSYENIEIWCGDIFDLTLADMSGIKALYDRASLTTFPADRRAAYVRHFSENLPKDCQILLITDETPDEQQLESVKTIDSEIIALYAADYQIDLLYGNKCIKKDPAFPEASKRLMEEKVYHIKRQQLAEQFKQPGSCLFV
ncbi:MAG: thiopurine S-methyltransferase [Psychromonas sp.]|nr:thiopurine S-methyltransferase [Psychromonas sp.]